MVPFASSRPILAGLAAGNDGANAKRRRPVKIPKNDQDRWFKEEVQPHEPILRAHLRNAFPSLPDVDDIVQESYLQLIRAKKTGPIHFAKAFLFTTARNVACDLLRRKRIIPFLSVMEIERLAVIGEETGTADAVGRQEELAFLSAAIRDLPERCRQVVTLRKLYGLSQKSIAAQLGISENTVEVQVAKGMRRIAAALARHGLP